MREKLVKFINLEDKKNPYTDQALAKLLNCQRENVTTMRKDCGIGDSRERRKELLMKSMLGFIKENASVSERELTRLVKEEGFSISRYVIRDMMKQIKEDEIEPVETKVEITAYEKLIGHDGSLKAVVDQAKAAMLYPPKGLHTLITGPSGVGKSELASTMYDFATESGMLRNGDGLVIFNCADYANNEQLLIAQLFGYAKGAFTGAESEKQGLVEVANGGILFLDEVHRLPPKGQEMLFHLLDKEIFRRLGDSVERKASVTLIAATTENVDSSLLVTFRRRIPMTIEIPSLGMRPLEERMRIIRRFLFLESSRTNKPIRLHQDVVNALMLYDCPGNIGQIRSDIQVACARSFLHMISENSAHMVVTLDHVTDHVREGLLKNQQYRSKHKELINEEIIVLPDEEDISSLKVDSSDSGYAIYRFIEERHTKLLSRNLETEVINYIVGNEVEDKIKKHIQRNTNKSSHSLVSSEIDSRLFEVVHQMLDIGVERLGVELSKIHYALTMHIAASLERLSKGKQLVNPNMKNIKNKYREEFEVALEMLEVLENTLDILMPEDEAGFIALYLNQAGIEETEKESAKVAVLVASHGNVAPEMATVANKLLNIDHAHGLSMPLDLPFDAFLEQASTKVEEIDEGKGVFMMVDMGSLTTLDRLVTERTNIPTRLMSRVGTIQVIEAVRRATLPDADLFEISEYFRKDGQENGRKEYDYRPPVIITSCITGKGSAKRIKRMLKENMNTLGDTKIIACGAIGKSLELEIRQMMKEFTVIAVVGTMNPRIDDIPFISLESILDGTGIRMLEVMFEERGRKMTHHRERFKSKFQLDEEMVFTNYGIDTVEGALALIKKTFRDKNLVFDGYYDSMINREEMLPTGIDVGIALPHGEPQYVKEAGAVVIILDAPMLWGEVEIDIVVGLALKENCIYVVEAINNLFNRRDRVKTFTTYDKETIVEMIQREVALYA